MIANGQLAGVVLPDGFVIPAGFSGSFKPGDHYGTVQEAQFLEEHGVTGLAAYCAQFAAHYPGGNAGACITGPALGSVHARPRALVAA